MTKPTNILREFIDEITQHSVDLNVLWFEKILKSEKIYFEEISSSANCALTPNIRLPSFSSRWCFHNPTQSWYICFEEIENLLVTLLSHLYCKFLGCKGWKLLDIVSHLLSQVLFESLIFALKSCLCLSLSLPFSLDAVVSVLSNLRRCLSMGAKNMFLFHSCSSYK